MIAKLSHNPRVIAAPGHRALADEIRRFVGASPAVGDWFLKLEGLREDQAAALVGQAMKHGGGALLRRAGDGAADALVRLPGDCVDVFLGALALEGVGNELLEAIRATIAAWERSTFELRCGSKALHLGARTLLMGIVNVTPDSFSDGGEFLDPGKAVEHGLRLVAEGADLLDIGGESTRPGAQPVDAATECARVIPVVAALARQAGVPVSIDTSKALVAQQAFEAGATVLNDVTALRGDREMAAAAAHSGFPVVLMHMQGTPRTMQQAPRYGDLMSEVVAFLRACMALAVEAGVREEQLVVDPGLGFGKSLAHNLELLERVGELRSLGRPILLGPSRKSMIGKVLGVAAHERAFGTAALVALGIARGAHLLRVHDVAAMSQVARMVDATLRTAWAPGNSQG